MLCVIRQQALRFMLVKERETECISTGETETLLDLQTSIYSAPYRNLIVKD
jgi:hypothetical protein